MTTTEIQPDQVYKIDKETFDQIDKIVHDVKTRYTNWVSFVDEAVRIFATWWTNPPDAMPIFQHELWPHMTYTQHKVWKNKVRGPGFGAPIAEGPAPYFRERAVPNSTHIPNSTHT